MDEIILIEQVRNYDCLYNRKSKHYRNQSVRQEAWEEIAKEMNTTVVCVRNAWTKLRNCLINAKKRRETKSGQGTTTINPWKYEMEMSFLLPFLETRQTKNNLQSQQDEANSENNEVYKNEDDDAIEITRATFGDKQNVTEYVEDSHIPNIVSSEMPSVRKKARISAEESTSDPAQEILSNVRKNAELRIAKRNIERSTRDDVDMFYLSMAQIVKRLPAVDQANIRLNICTMVSQAEIRQNLSNLGSNRMEMEH